MKVAVMQPYFFPYLGYFDLINSVDEWIVFDTAQYIRHGWVNRNRILHPQSGWQYLVAPVKKHSRDTPINNIEMVSDSDWKRRIVGQLLHYKNHAPFFKQTITLVESCLADDERSLSRLNVSVLEKTCAHLGIRFRYRYFSEMGVELGPIESSGDWGLRISQAVGASEYVNPPGGADLFDGAKFATNGVNLLIKKLIDFEFACGKYTFIPHLSVIDALMWNSPESIKERLDVLR